VFLLRYAEANESITGGLCCIHLSFLPFGDVQDERCAIPNAFADESSFRASGDGAG